MVLFSRSAVPFQSAVLLSGMVYLAEMNCIPSPDEGLTRIAGGSKKFGKVTGLCASALTGITVMPIATWIGVL